MHLFFCQPLESYGVVEAFGVDDIAEQSMQVAVIRCLIKAQLTAVLIEEKKLG